MAPFRIQCHMKRRRHLRKVAKQQARPQSIAQTYFHGSQLGYFVCQCLLFSSSCHDGNLEPLFSPSCSSWRHHKTVCNLRRESFDSTSVFVCVLASGSGFAELNEIVKLIDLLMYWSGSYSSLSART